MLVSGYCYLNSLLSSYLKQARGLLDAGYWLLVTTIKIRYSLLIQEQAYKLGL